MQTLHAAFPNVKFDVSNIKLPKMKKGYIGTDQSGDDNNKSDIPLFIVISKTSTPNGNNGSTSPPSPSTPVVNQQPFNNHDNSNTAVVATSTNATATLGASNDSVNPRPTQSQTITAPTATTTVAVSVPAPSSSASSRPSVTNAPSTPPPVNNSTAAPRGSTTQVSTTPPTAPNSANVTPTAPLTAASLNALSSTPNSSARSPGADSEPALPRRQSTGTMGGRQSIVVLPGPPKMVGWLRKQGHIIRNWKKRYFVLNNGFLTYYVDKSDSPPFGIDAKGQVCLAGFKIVDAKNSGNRILLKFDPTAIDAEMVTFLRKTGSGSTSNNSDDHAGDLLMEAEDASDRDRWVAAIEMHTLYIETASLSSFNKSKNTDGFDVEEDVEIQFQSANDFAAEANNTIIDNSQDVAEQRGEQDSARRASFSTVKTANTLASVSGGPRRQSMIKSSVNSINSQKWTVYLERYEDIICSGVISKPNPLGVIHLIRELILVKTDVNRLPESMKGKPYTYKRLLYVDTNSYDMRGEIRWQTDSKKNPVIRKVSIMICDTLDIILIKLFRLQYNDSCFEISDVKRIYFYPKDNKSVDEWVNYINSITP